MINIRGCFFSMMFFDSSFFIAFFIRTDNYHDLALKLYNLVFDESVLINSVVLTEVMNSLKMTKHGPNYDGNLDELFDFLVNYVELDFLTVDDYKSAFVNYKVQNQCINFSDFMILRTMGKYNISKIVSFDSDFDKIKGITRIFL